MEKLPDVPHVAVFDTLFHTSMPPEAREYAVPRRWRDEWGVRRYGFHGLSVAWASERAADHPGPARGGSAPGGVPPRRRVLGDGGRRRTVVRHDDGLLAARGRPDGDPVRIGRPGGAHLPGAHPWDGRRRRRPRPDRRVRAARAGRVRGHARPRGRGPRRKRGGEARDRRLLPPGGGGGRRDGGRRRRHGRGRLHRRHRGAVTRHARGDLATGSACSAWSSTRPATRRPTATATSPPRPPWRARWSSRAARRSSRRERLETSSAPSRCGFPRTGCGAVPMRNRRLRVRMGPWTGRT